jgi:hypothetical protein
MKIVIVRGVTTLLAAFALSATPAVAHTLPIRSCVIPAEFSPGTFAFSLRATQNVRCSTASAVMKYWSSRDLGPPDTFRLGGRRWRFASWRFNHRSGSAARQTLTFTADGGRRVTFTTQPTN